MAKMIEISEEEYIRLNNADDMLTCLYQGGVDNWDYYDEALDAYHDLKAQRDG